MKTAERSTYRKKQPSAMALVQKQLQKAPGGLITATDIKGASPEAASKALSRLAQQGLIQRVRKGVYHIPKETLLGPSQPSPPAVMQKALGAKARPTGVTAANLLGLTTQMAAQPEFATYTTARPRGTERVRLRLRPRARVAELDAKDAALLEVLRDRGCHGELGAEETYTRVWTILLEGEAPKPSARSVRLRRLRDAALMEPPRVRAILGALMESAGLPESLWGPLRGSLNRLTRFDFGLFRDLPNARDWQAR